ncbi:hypothetical protein CAPTEDRAFT_21623 [Capitella teleta]|nr:hypothetical protein CAPTEDRAFT_21623 [Capitella teleta]|eukprot:ELU14746.1 hypothetical protein CAPTEDRAFT_21623 [Capitella teleta]
MELRQNGDDDDVSGDDDDYEDCSDSDDEDMDFQDTVQVDFEARNAEDSDFHGIRKLLQQTFLKANIDLSELTNTIISQNYVGSVLKQPILSDEESDNEVDDDDTFGIVTALNMTERKDLDCIKQLKNYLYTRCAQCGPNGKQKKAQLAEILESVENQVGFLINERFINIPAQVALPCFESLIKEMEEACKKQMKYDFSHFVVISKTCKLPIAVSSKVDMRTFINAEEELILQESEMSFEFSVKSERDTCISGEWDDEEEALEPFRTVMVFKKDRFPVILEEINQLLLSNPLPGAQ